MNCSTQKVCLFDSFTLYPHIPLLVFESLLGPILNLEWLGISFFYLYSFIKLWILVSPSIEFTFCFYRYFKQCSKMQKCLIVVIKTFQPVDELDPFYWWWLISNCINHYKHSKKKISMNCTHNAHHEPKSSSLLIVGIVYHDGVIFSKKKKN